MPLSVRESERLAEAVLEVYEQAEHKMLTRIANQMSRGVGLKGWTATKYAEVYKTRSAFQSIVDDMRTERNGIASKAFASAYNIGAKDFTSGLPSYLSSAGVSGTGMNAQKVINILAEWQDTMNASDRVILRQAADAYSDVIGKTAALLATGTIDYRQATRQALDDFADKGITGFVDAAGRQWNMGTYAEMALLTAIEKATVAGYVDTMQSYGFDLAIVSSHAGACPLCEAWEDVVISVSGDDHDYPSLDEAEGAGLFHPRCLHHLSTYYPGITKGTGKVRNAPREIAPPSENYTARSRQRYMERRIRQWKRRMAVATDYESERFAFAQVRKWQANVRELIEDAPDVLPRKYWREGGRQLLRFKPNGGRK